ncbi:FAD-binding oxidoreductase [Pseudomonas sp. TH10]|nr:FAD-binding oxidoreductase [Pseudomonas sp. TH10]
MKGESDVNQKTGVEVVIVGAGLIGLSTAYFLQRLGAKVTLIEKAFIADSIPNLGLAKALLYCKSTQSGSLTDRGLTLTEVMVAELEYRGSRQDDGDEVFVTDARSPGSKRSVLLSDFAQDIADSCRKSGVRIIETDPVSTLLVKNDVVHGVETARGFFTADVVVISAGLQSQPLLRSVGLSVQLQAADSRLGASSARQGIPGVFTGMVPLTPNGEPYVGRPEGILGLYLGIGHDTNPAAAIAVGEMLATGICTSSDALALTLTRTDCPMTQSTCNSAP